MHIDKSVWKDFLIFVEQERGDIHPVAYELIGQARKLAAKVDFKVHCVLIGGAGTKENAKKLLAYGIDTAYVYEDEAFEDFRCDNYANAFADIILRIQPSSVLVGATALGRSLAPRVATRFKTGLTADCTKLDNRHDSDSSGLWRQYYGPDCDYRNASAICDCSLSRDGSCSKS